MRDRVHGWPGIGRRESPNSPGPERPLWSRAVASDSGAPSLDRKRGGRSCGWVARDRTLRLDRTLGISANRLLADLTAVYPDPTFRLGRERPLRPDTSDALYCKSTVGLVMLNVEAALVSLSLIARRRAIQAGFPIQPAALFDCSIPFTTAEHVIVSRPISTVHLCLTASDSHSAVRTATRIRIQGGQG